MIVRVRVVLTRTVVGDGRFDNLSGGQSQVICEATIRNDNIGILPADKGRVTVVMDKTDYFDKMDPQTYGEL